VVSHWRAEFPPDYLEKNGIPGIQGIDTRALPRRLRVRGALNGFISRKKFLDAEGGGAIFVGGGVFFFFSFAARAKDFVLWAWISEGSHDREASVDEKKDGAKAAATDWDPCALISSRERKKADRAPGARSAAGSGYPS